MANEQNLKLNKIHNTNCLDGLKNLEPESIDCCVTSPPYWALRDYGVKGQLGLETKFEEYVKKLCDIFDEVKRVLKKTGTCWVNIGDTYSRKNANFGVSTKSLIGIPFHFALEMIKRGWILRNTVIWHKPNCMPSSAKRRFTVDFEYVFFFVKNTKYYFETQYEPLSEVTIKDIKRRKNMACITGEKGSKHFKNKKSAYTKQKTDRLRTDFVDLNKGRIKRSVWKIKVKPFRDAHFATYPEELIFPMIDAGCPEFICSKCGEPRKKVWKVEEQIPVEIYKGKGKKNYKSVGVQNPSNVKRRVLKSMATKRTSFKWSKCQCKNKFIPGIVLDPFIGSGTTALVALKQNKNFIGFELNKEYIKIATKRINPFLEQSKLDDAL